MATIVTVYTGLSAVNRPLTNAEIDANFINLNYAVTNATSNYIRTSITATAAQTNFTAQYTVGYLQVYLNGIALNSSDYTATSGTSVVLNTAAALGDIVEVVGYTIGANNDIGIGSQNLDGGVPGSKYIGILTSISGGTAISALIDTILPYNSIAPTVTLPSNTLAVGAYVAVNEGTWTGTPTPTYTYQWQQYTVDSIYINISGATFYRYQAATSDLGTALACIVTATNTAGSISVRTALTATITQVVPSNTVAPTISGSARVGQTLTVNVGTWTGTPTPTTFTYKWYNSSIYVTIGTSSTYTVASSDLGYRIYCFVTADNGTINAGTTSAYTSVVTSASGNSAPVNTALPTITGTLKSGQTIEVSTGTWSAYPESTYSYQWGRNAQANIVGATSYKYTLTPDDIYGTVYCKVTATNSVGSATAASASTQDVYPGVGAPVNTVAPSISGTAQVDQTLTANIGTWTGTPTPTYAYEWQNSSYILLSTSSTYTVASTDVGKTIFVYITATNTDGRVTVQSAQTVAIPTPSNSAPVNTALPIITGTVRAGQTIQVSTGTWTGYPTPTYSYEWRIGGGNNTYAGSTSSSITIPPGYVGSKLYCRVTATNTAGTSGASSADTATITKGAGAPVNTVAPTISGTAQVGQTLTANIGTWTGTPTPTYTYQWWYGSGTFANITTRTTSPNYTIVSGDAGNVIYCSVEAGNTDGYTQANSGNTATVTVPVTVPGAPTNVSVVSYNSTTATITFTAPASNGGSAITGYTVTSNPGSISATGTSSPITITGLTVGTSYQFTVYATNAIGNGSSASTTAITPTNTTKGIFAFGVSANKAYESATTLVGNSGTLISELSTSNGTPRINSAGASYGNGLALFAYGAWNGASGTGGSLTAMNISSKVNSSGVLQSDSTGAGTARAGLGAASYGGDKIVFGFGYNYASNTLLNTLSLADNTGTIVSESSGTGTARASVAAASYGGDKAIFGFGNVTGGNTNFITLIGNTGTIVSDITTYSTSSVFSKSQVAAASYGGDKAIFAFGYTTSNASSKNLVDNTGSVASTVGSAGFARHGLAAVGYGGDKAVFGFGATGNYQSMTNTVTNAGVVSIDTTNSGYIGREALSGAGYSAA
jgi:hypothetical protein